MVFQYAHCRNEKILEETSVGRVDQQSVCTGNVYDD